MRLRCLPKSVVAVGLALSFEAGMLAAREGAHAQGRGRTAVETCRSLEAQSGEEAVREIYGSFGGCVVAFTNTASGVADIAHGCHFLVDRGLFATHGECVQFFKSL